MLHAEKCCRDITYLGLQHAKHPQHKSPGRNIKNEAATRKQAKWRQNSVATDFLGRDRGFHTNAKKSFCDITNWVPDKTSKMNIE